MVCLQNFRGFIRTHTHIYIYIYCIYKSFLPCFEFGWRTMMVPYRKLGPAQPENQLEPRMVSSCRFVFNSIAGLIINHIWLVVWTSFLFFHILGIIIATDFHIFQRGWYTTNQLIHGNSCAIADMFCGFCRSLLGVLKSLELNWVLEQRCKLPCRFAWITWAPGQAVCCLF